VPSTAYAIEEEIVEQFSVSRSSLSFIREENEKFIVVFFTH
jgi:hypothetical protein